MKSNLHQIYGDGEKVNTFELETYLVPFQKFLIKLYFSKKCLLVVYYCRKNYMSLQERKKTLSPIFHKNYLKRTYDFLILNKLWNRLHYRIKYKLFHLISWLGNFPKTNSFFIFSGESLENLRKLLVFGKFPHQEIRLKSLHCMQWLQQFMGNSFLWNSWVALHVIIPPTLSSLMQCWCNHKFTSTDLEEKGRISDTLELVFFEAHLYQMVWI